MPDAPSPPSPIPASPLRPAIWGVALAAILLAVIAVGVVFLHSLTPPDRSTAAASVEGYFAAVRDQDYARAWQYTELSVQGGESQSAFIAGLKADDARYGRVLSFTIGSIQVDTAGHASTTVRVVRAATSGVPIQYDAVLGQYGSLWLVDSVSSA